MFNRRAFTRFGAAVATLLAACGGNSKSSAVAPVGPTGPNTLTDAERRGGWVLLFDGRTLTGWHAYKQPTGVTTGWEVRDGAITRTASAGDLVSDRQYGSFELDFDWKIGQGGSSAVYIWGNEGTDHMYENAPGYQLIDNAGNADGKSPITSAGAISGLVPPLRDASKPVGEWNQSRIVVHGDKVEQWLNGTKVVETHFDTHEMVQRIAKSRFKPYQSFGKDRRGHIGLHDSGDPVWAPRRRDKGFPELHTVASRRPLITARPFPLARDHPRPGASMKSNVSRLSLMMFLQYAVWGAWLPLAARYLTASVADGGLGFTSTQMGTILGLAGSIGAIAVPFYRGTTR